MSTYTRSRLSLAAALVALALATGGMGVAPAPAQATTLIPINLDQMAAKADLIVQATVVAQRSYWGPDKRFIYTTTELQIVTTLKGEAKAGERVLIRQLGGTVGDLAQTISGNASFAQGEEVLVFLDSDEAEPVHYVIGMMQGKFAIDRSGPEPTVVRNLSSSALSVHATTTATKRAPTLVEFQERIRRALR